MSVYVRLALKSSEGTWKITSQHHFPLDEGAVSVLIAGLGEGDDEGMAMDYPAYRVTHGNFAGDIGKQCRTGSCLVMPLKCVENITV